MGPSILSHHTYAPAICTIALIPSRSEHFCILSHFMTVERLTLWNTVEVLRLSAGFSHGRGNESAQQRGQRNIFLKTKKLHCGICEENEGVDFVYQMWVKGSLKYAVTYLWRASVGE